MTPPPLSNYPRAPDGESVPTPRVWRGDLAIGLLGIGDLFVAWPEWISEAFAARSLAELGWRLLGVLVISAIAVGLDLLLIFRKRWGMWVLLVLNAISIASDASDGFAEWRKGSIEATSMVLGFVTTLYLVGRLFGVYGPRPR